MSEKSRFRGPFEKQHGKRSQICVTGPLSSSLITAKSVDLEKVSLVDMQNLGTTCEDIRWRWQVSCC